MHKLIQLIMRENQLKVLVLSKQLRRIKLWKIKTMKL